MIQEIASGIYRLEIPLPMSELQSINAYVVRGIERHLIIDTGVNTGECMSAMEKALKALDIEPDDLDFFITHYHGDHFGLVHRLMGDVSSVYISEKDGRAVERIATGDILKEIKGFILLSGIPNEGSGSMAPPDAARPFKPDRPFPFKFVKDDDFLQIGDYRFQCVATPGHSVGHTCLYESERRILFSGDHILGDITPSIQARSLNVNPLADYLMSLDKIQGLDVDLVLPGHRNMIRNCQRRIRELRAHHKERADEVISILRTGKKNAYQVAALMTWSTDCDSWDAFPGFQKFFATGEAFAHLVYLGSLGSVKIQQQGEKAFFSLV